jgi:hypothetical protein
MDYVFDNNTIDDESSILVLNKIAQLYVKIGQSQCGDMLFNKCYEKSLSIYGAKSDLTSWCLRSLTNYYLQAGNKPKSLALCRNVITMARNIISNNESKHR